VVVTYLVVHIIFAPTHFRLC